MNFKTATLLAAFTAAPVTTANNLRGDALAHENQEHRELFWRGFTEKLGVCTGAVCGFWGDPHMITCDGLTYDCQGIGIFTIMKNHMYNIQGNFVDVGAREHVLTEGWGLTHGASIANDIMIDYMQDEDVPVMQFGFGDVKNWVKEPPSEEGCEEWMTFSPVDMPGQGRSVEVSQVECRKRCEGITGCTHFTYWADGGCHMNDGNQVKKPSNRSWARALLGSIDGKCGYEEEKDIEIQGVDESNKHGSIGPNCPLLMYLDGEMVDLSHINPNTQHSFLWGERGDDHFVELVGSSIRIVHKTDTGDISEINLRTKGEGPGEMWSCHWDFYVCLNKLQAEQFVAPAVNGGSTGLMGSPDMNKMNDWMDKEGNKLDIATNQWGSIGHADSFNYCVDNWCVSQSESLMTYHGDTNYGDHKCEADEFIDFRKNNTQCLLSADSIEFKCKDMPPLLKYACEMDCCVGGCGEVEETKGEIEQVVDLKKLEEEEGDASFGFQFGAEEAECTTSEKSDTPTTKCPGSGIVKLLKTTGDEPLPEDSADLFYDISFDEVNNLVEFRVNNPFEAAAKVFVKREKKVMNGFMDPICDGEQLTAKGCDDDYLVEVACHDYDNIDPFALVNVYFASVAVSPLNDQATIDKCCEPEEFEPAVGIVEYTFEIQCGCPGKTAE